MNLTLALTLSLWASACPFCPTQGQTLTGEVNSADLIVVGVMKNAQVNPDGNGTTELHVKTVVKDHPYLTGRKVLIMPRYQPEDPANPNAEYMVFAYVTPLRLRPGGFPPAQL
jgi:hypothetical protein